MNTDEKGPKQFADFLGELRKEWGIPDGPVTPRTPEEDAELTRRAIQEQRITRFREICPTEFQKKIDPTLLENPTAWAEADRWEGEFPGLWLWSNETGMAKTRMLWRKFGELHVKRGRVVARITGANLAEEYHDAFNRSRTADFYAQFRKLGVVMLDDLDKMAMPDAEAPYGQQEQGLRNGRMLRELFDRFYEWHVPVLATANEPIEFFAARIGASAERRMREVCREIAF